MEAKYKKEDIQQRSVKKRKKSLIIKIKKKKRKVTLK
jgi:hypothetical protein